MSTLSERMRAEADEVEALEAKYYELILAVVMKHEGETRHETAMRYIVERENIETSGSVQELSPKDKLMQAYEKAGLANALYVKEHYGNGSRG